MKTFILFQRHSFCGFKQGMAAHSRCQRREQLENINDDDNVFILCIKRVTKMLIFSSSYSTFTESKKKHFGNENI